MLDTNILRGSNSSEMSLMTFVLAREEATLKISFNHRNKTLGGTQFNCIFTT